MHYAAGRDPIALMPFEAATVDAVASRPLVLPPFWPTPRRTFGKRRPTCGRRFAIGRASKPASEKAMRGYTKWAIVPLALIVSLSLLALGLFVVVVNGGIRNTVLNMKPRPVPDSPILRRDKTKLEAGLDTALQTVVTNDEFVHYETSTQDACYDGQNNFKVTEGFSHRCTLRLTRFYGFDGDFRKEMIDFERGLLAAGWQSDDSYSMERYMTNYYDVRTNVTVEQIAHPIGYHRAALELKLASAERKTQILISLDDIEDTHCVVVLRSETLHECERSASKGDDGSSIFIGNRDLRSLFRKLTYVGRR
jgi:hypothetical protein